MAGAAGVAGPDPRRLAAARPRSGSTSSATCRPAQTGHVVTAAPAPRPFVVRAEGGQTVFRGLSEPWPGPDPSSGLAVHTADFTALTGPCERLRLTADGATSHPFRIAADLYDGWPRTRCGSSPAAVRRRRSTRRPRPGTADRPGTSVVPPNRGDTAVRGWTGPDAERLYPGWRLRPASFDVSGGWYDAGDHGKYVVNGGLSVASCCSSDRSARAPAPGRASARRALLEECRWELDWLLRMQVPAGEPLAGHGLPSGARHRLDAAAAGAAPRTRPSGCCTGRPRRRPSTWPRSPPRAPGCSPTSTRRTPHGCSPPPASPTAAARRASGPARARRRRRLRRRPVRRRDARRRVLLGRRRAVADHRRADATGPTSRPRRAHRGDVFDPDGFDWDRVAAPARLDLATSTPAAGPAVCGRCSAPPTGWSSCSAASPGASPTRRPPAGTGVPTGASSATWSCSPPPTTSPGRPRLPRRPRSPASTTCPRPQRARPELRHRLRHRHRAPAADPPFRPRPRPRVPAAATRRAGRRAGVEALPRLPRRPALRRPAAPVLLPRRADLGDHQRRLHPMERRPGVDGGVRELTQQTPQATPVPRSPPR